MKIHTTFRIKSLHVATLGLFAALALSASGCKSNDQQTANGTDPAAANMAAANGSQPAQPTQVMGTSASYTPQQQSQSYPQQQQPAPIEQNYNNQAPPPPDANYDQGYDDNQDAIQADQAPPPLPEYDQPEAPDPNYIWTPGYWYYGPDGYYWVPGAWVAAPYYGALWTPGYWGFFGGHYRFHHGYWGLHIGYYGGIDYGFGYIGVGYEGGYWQGNNFYYNRSVNRINTSNIHNVYEHSVSGPRGGGRVSFNGPGGVQARPQPAELAARREQHTAPMQTQVALRNDASRDKGQAFNTNHGRPTQATFARPVAATPGIAAPPARGSFGGRTGEVNNNRPAEVTRPGQPAVNNGVQPQRPGQQQGRPQPGQPQPNHTTPQQIQNQQRTQQEQGRPQQGQPQPAHITPQQVPNRPQTRQQVPQRNQNVQPQQPRQMRPQPVQQARPQPAERPAPQPRVEQPRPAPQQRVEQPRAEAPRPAPQAAPRPAAPPPHVEAPRAAPAARPAPTAKEEHPR